MAREAWMDDRNCKNVDDPNIFFPATGENWKADQAKALCWSCPVRENCLEYAQRNKIYFGIYGGLTNRERASLRARGRAAMMVKPSQVGRVPSKIGGA